VTGLSPVILEAVDVVHFLFGVPVLCHSKERTNFLPVISLPKVLCM
jgi:hypothetical protein